MSVAVVTGSAGLVGSEASSFFAGLGLDIAGIDNDMRRVFFGSEASVDRNKRRLENELGPKYRHLDVDIRDRETIGGIFGHYGPSVKLVVHAAGQPSHDWAARNPMVDFDVNARGTVVLLEAVRNLAPDAVFVFVSTNKVYGDAPNLLPFVERETRWEIEPGHAYADGVREDMPVDRSLHSLFGASKLAADVYVQEYGRYFGMRTVCFRCGCLTGPNHAGVELHGFLAHLMRCTARGKRYTVFGYKGKQVRDNLHSADLVRAFYEFFKAPRAGEVYNIGGGRFSNCSVLEAMQTCQEIAGRELDWSCSERHRRGDHIWWISDYGKFADHFPDWTPRYRVPQILREIYGRL